MFRVLIRLAAPPVVLPRLMTFRLLSRPWATIAIDRGTLCRARAFPLTAMVPEAHEPEFLAAVSVRRVSTAAVFSLRFRAEALCISTSAPFLKSQPMFALSSNRSTVVLSSNPLSIPASCRLVTLLVPQTIRRPARVLNVRSVRGNDRVGTPRSNLLV